MSKKVLIVAELSANHGNSIENAIATVRAAKFAGADAIKIQTYTADTITLDCDNEYFQIKQGTLWDGTTLHKLYQQAYTPWEWHKAIQAAAHDEGLLFFSTPFDNSSVDFLEEMNVPLYKIASFEINDLPLIKYVARTGKPIIISTGVATEQEIQNAIETCNSVGNCQITLLKCTSSYPAPLELANLQTIPDMKSRFNVSVGLSDHTTGSIAAIVAVSLGAEIIEKHFILDKNFGGPDASFSITPPEFKLMVDQIRDAEKALGIVDYTQPSLSSNSYFKRSLFVTSNMRAGEVFSPLNIRSIRPNVGLQPIQIENILGRKAKTDIEKGTPLSWEIVE